MESGQGQRFDKGYEEIERSDLAESRLGSGERCRGVHQQVDIWEEITMRDAPRAFIKQDYIDCEGKFSRMVQTFFEAQATCLTVIQVLIKRTRCQRKTNIDKITIKKILNRKLENTERSRETITKVNNNKRDRRRRLRIDQAENSNLLVPENIKISHRHYKNEEYFASYQIFLIYLQLFNKISKLLLIGPYCFQIKKIQSLGTKPKNVLVTLLLIFKMNPQWIVIAIQMDFSKRVNSDFSLAWNGVIFWGASHQQTIIPPHEDQKAPIKILKELSSNPSGLDTS
ncbi:hypothetical protein OXYTRIMIC_797 [Oxytricha trifallax]|uniref:Uncharacterized protein n=1 Tax=Oxytricha trifallax TaxID=1172189 RepID=A0A073HZ22_9SPIT|nr:hypothetical protein OXYTRIMIC_797 [Oxytricha trifallax]